MQLLRFEVLRAVLLQVQVFWDVSPCRLVNSDGRFEGSLCFRTQSIQRDIPENSNLQILKYNNYFFSPEMNFLALVTSIIIAYLFPPHKFAAIRDRLSD